MQLGEFAAHRRAPVGAERGRQVGKSIPDPVRRFEEDERAGFGCQQLHRGDPALARQEAFKHEAVGRQAADRERHQHGTRARERRHGDAGGRRGDHERVAGIADGRHPGVAQHQHIRLARELHDLGRFRALVVLVQRDQPRPVLDPERVQQLDRGAGVLRGDDLHAAQRLDQPAGGVAQVADRRRREDDHPAILPRRVGTRVRETAVKDSGQRGRRRPHRPGIHEFS